MKLIANGRTNQPTDQQTDIVLDRAAIAAKNNVNLFNYSHTWKYTRMFLEGKQNTYYIVFCAFCNDSVYVQKSDNCPFIFETNSCYMRKILNAYMCGLLSKFGWIGIHHKKHFCYSSFCDVPNLLLYKVPKYPVYKYILYKI